MSIDALSILDSRTKNIPGFGYKLQGGHFGLDTTAGDLNVNESEMSILIPFADGNRRDGVGDLLEVTGIDLTRHSANPFVLFDHGKKVDLPIGLAQDKSGQYMVEIDSVAKTARGKCFMYQSMKKSEHLEFCEQLFDLAAKKFIRAGSIGYQVQQAMQLPADYMRGTPQGLHLVKVLMLEFSLVVLPANADTVVKVLSMPKICGKKLSPYLVKSLEGYAPTRKAQLGWEGKAGPRELTHDEPNNPNLIIARPTAVGGEGETHITTPNRYGGTTYNYFPDDNPVVWHPDQASADAEAAHLNQLYAERNPSPPLKDQGYVPLSAEQQEWLNSLPDIKTVKVLAYQLNKARADTSDTTRYGVEPVREDQPRGPHNVTLHHPIAGAIPVGEFADPSSAKRESDRQNFIDRRLSEILPAEPQLTFDDEEEVKALAIQLNKDLVEVPLRNLPKNKVPPAKWTP